MLIQSDGTAAGTRPVLAADGQPVRWPSSLLPVGNRLVFAGYSREGDQALWQTDGTAAGTRMLRVLEGPGESSFTWSLVRAGKRIFFRAYSPDTGRELWAMGTPQGRSRRAVTRPQYRRARSVFTRVMKELALPPAMHEDQDRRIVAALERERPRLIQWLRRQMADPAESEESLAAGRVSRGAGPALRPGAVRSR